MAAPEGNKNALGNKGGRRKSAYQENADYEKLWKRWLTPGVEKALLARVKAGKGSLEDIFFALAHGKDIRVLLTVFKKLYPDLHKLQGDKDNPLEVIHQITGMRISKEKPVKKKKQK